MAKEKAQTIVRRFEHSGDTKRYQKFQITEEMMEQAREGGENEKDIRRLIGTIYISLDEKDLPDSIYVTISSVAPEGFVDYTIA